jgi:hypothetical protein
MPDRYAKSIGARDSGLKAGDFDDFSVAPQSIQIVIGARLFGEHVDQVIAVIGQDPLCVIETFHAHRTLTAFVQLPADLFGDGLDLFWIASGGNYKKVGERGDIAQIQHADVGRFLRFSGAGSDEPGRGREGFGEFLPGSIT